MNTQKMTKLPETLKSAFLSLTSNLVDVTRSDSAFLIHLYFNGDRVRAFIYFNGINCRKLEFVTVEEIPLYTVSTAYTGNVSMCGFEFLLDIKESNSSETNSAESIVYISAEITINNTSELKENIIKFYDLFEKCVINQGCSIKYNKLISGEDYQNLEIKLEY